MKTYSKPSRKYAKRKRHFKQYRDNRAPKAYSIGKPKQSALIS